MEKIEITISWRESMGKIITNIQDPKSLERMAWHFSKKNIVILNSEPVNDNELVLNLTNVQLKETYQDSIQIINQIFKENNIDVAVIIPDLVGLYLYAYISGFKKLPMVHICKNEKLEPVIVSPGALGKTKIKMLKYINSNQGSTTNKIFQGINLKPGTSSAYLHINTLKDLQLVKEENKKYYITDLGSTFLKIL